MNGNTMWLFKLIDDGYGVTWVHSTNLFVESNCCKHSSTRERRNKESSWGVNGTTEPWASSRGYYKLSSCFDLILVSTHTSLFKTFATK